MFEVNFDFAKYNTKRVIIKYPKRHFKKIYPKIQASG